MTREEILNSFHLKMPIIAAPMFLVSEIELAFSCIKSGIIGSFPALNQRSTEGFENWVEELQGKIKEEEKNQNKPLPPFAVNLIVHPSNPRVQADLAICVKHKVPIVITSLGAVKEVVDAVHGYGGLVFHDVIKMRHAEKAIEAGVDGLILVCAGAGGHGGTLNPMPFVHEVRESFDGVIALSGSISTGQDVASAMQMGADLAYMGTRFINTEEANSSDNYKQMIIDSDTADVIYTSAVSGVAGNFLKPSLESVGITQEMWNETKKVDFGHELGEENSKAWKDLWSAGQGVASIHDVLPVKELVTRLKIEFKSAIELQSEWLKRL